MPLPKGNIPWNKGLTKENDDRVKKQSIKVKGRKRAEKGNKLQSLTMKRMYKEGIIKPWNKGLTKENSEGVKKGVEKRIGRKASAETNKKSSKSHILYYKNNPEALEQMRKNGKEKNAKYWLGKKRDEKTRNKISLSLSGENHPNFGKHLSEETRKKISIKHTGLRWTLSEQSRINIGNGHRGIRCSEEKKKKLRERTKSRWDDPKRRKEFLRGLEKRPNKLESKLQNIIEKNDLPFTYVGSRNCWICCRNPDFVHKTDKIIIEVFGDYWHSKLIVGQEQEEHEKETISFYKSHKYDCLVFWEREINMLPEKSIVNTINNFIETTYRRTTK